MAVAPRRVLLILLGASEFPRSAAHSPSPAFANSHAALAKYFLDEYGDSLLRADCLDLFNDERSCADQDCAIADWLDLRVPNADDRGRRATDLIVCYVGHGGFRDESKDYFLVVRATRGDNPFYHSIAVESLWTTLRAHARRLRRFIILDACFASAAARFFQADLAEVVEAKIDALTALEGRSLEPSTVDAPPEYGTALFCSSSASDPSSSDGEEGMTRFSGALVGVLRKGDARRRNWLSLSSVNVLLWATMISKYKAEAIRPHLHAPDQAQGNLLDMPLFPNLARQPILQRSVLARGRGVDDIRLQLALGNPSGAGVRRDNYLVQRPQYALSYNADAGRANWVSWHVRREDFGPVPRRDSWRVDTQLPSSVYRVAARDYSGSGYDRGHLCGPGDRRGSIEDLDSVFVMSNVVPQARIRNRDLWLSFEEYCRVLANEGNQLFVVAGPGGEASRIAGGRIAVPQYLWKIAIVLPEEASYSDVDGDAGVIAIQMSNSQLAAVTDWRACQVTVANLEDQLGFRFLTNLNESARRALRSKLDLQQAEATTP